MASVERMALLYAHPDGEEGSASNKAYDDYLKGAEDVLSELEETVLEAEEAVFFYDYSKDSLEKFKESVIRKLRELKGEE